jgi:hypothetical protein
MCACLPAALLTVVLTAVPALAEGRPYDMDGPLEGGDPGEGLSPLETIALYVLVPALIMAVIAALTLLPGAVRGARYRPTRGWDAPPVWFAGPPNPTEAVAAVDAAQVATTTRGGARGSW